MKTPGSNPAAGSRRITLTVALVLVALVPTVGVLWFMTAAMRNERLAVKERLAEVYLNHLTSLRWQVTVFWQTRQAALRPEPKDSPAQLFGRVVGTGRADSMIIFGDSDGLVSYPAASGPKIPREESGDWAAARELEFGKQDLEAAAAAFGRIAAATTDIHARARALQAQAGCLLKAGRMGDAIRRLAELGDDAMLRHALTAQGTLIAPNAQLLILKLAAGEVGPALRAGLSSGAIGDQNPVQLGEPAPPSLLQRTLDALVRRVNDYSDDPMSGNQRRFLMGEVKRLVPEAAVFPTLEAEVLAADYLEREPMPPVEMKLQRTLLPAVWRMPSLDGARVALFREERLRSELTMAIAEVTLPDVKVTVLAPGEAGPTDTRVPTVEASDLLPGWRLALSFSGEDPFASASERQLRFYLWSGAGLVAIIALLGFLVARYVGAQMRLARLKNELVSTVSHELKTPLASMRALVDTLAAGRVHDDRQLKEYLQLIAKENVRLTHVIENFLAFSRMERGRQRFQFEALAPAEVVSAAVEALQEKLNLPGCQLEVAVPPDLPRVRGDFEALATVLINLLDNACKYTNGEKRLVVRAVAERGAVRFEVEDNGIGLAPAETRRIFERFYQVDQSLTRQRGGCGLGLSIVKFIVDEHRGTVGVKSKSGKGSTFRVSIPVENHPKS